MLTRATLGSPPAGRGGARPRQGRLAPSLRLAAAGAAAPALLQWQHRGGGDSPEPPGLPSQELVSI